MADRTASKLKRYILCRKENTPRTRKILRQTHDIKSVYSFRMYNEGNKPDDDIKTDSQDQEEFENKVLKGVEHTH